MSMDYLVSFLSNTVHQSDLKTQMGINIQDLEFD